ncbi:TauD/TfdA family dioxygenase [Novosphingobium sp. Fuku2-ISO-50]|uniref:TauD/TfdA dioxygenase family protein n=1 Tax=Novosphingobium sp. Fuku2-ISO-50 TaxID=1739114 RepID=UPI00076DDC5B|nr:TauD/TfdA family dioxygenase [Novosphingobium sp. Fuku2-ISO-50]KUR81127.1 hypothetical protein AQZ50_00660 [Novosphingobium sp. Fuku2-ISO-50]
MSFAIHELNDGFGREISGLDITGTIPPETAAALRQVWLDHTLDPRFQYIHDWQNNDMVLWDNRRTMHMAFGHPVDQIRIVHRTTIKGTVAMGRIIDLAQGPEIGA